MSVVGYDFGNLNSYIAVARQGGIDVLTNDYSLHATPTCVSFGPKGRVMGVAARQQVNTNFKNTIINFKHLIGRKYSDPVTQLYRKFIPSEVVQLANDSIGLKVTYLGETRVFTPEQIAAAFLVKLKHITEDALGTKVNECVVSVPFYFSDNQRRALLAAGKIAGINLLKIVNENTAIGIAFGIYKGSTFPPEKEPGRIVAFVDVGNSCVQASVMAFHERKVAVLGATHDLTVGGLFFDEIIREYFHKEFLEKYKLDAQKNPRAWLRLLDESEKIKKLMSSNSTKIPLNIECFMEDKDVQGHMQRSQFEELAEPLFEKIRNLLRRLIEQSGLRVDDIAEVELLGGSARIPLVKQIIANFFNREPKTTMNMDEGVARGAGMQCAIISPSFKVKEFHVRDSNLFDIKLRYTGLNGSQEQTIFKRHDEFPFSKLLTVEKATNFSIEAFYNNASELPYTDNFIGRWTITDIQPDSEGKARKIRVKVRLNGNGILAVPSASTTEFYECKEEEEPMQTSEEPANAPQSTPTDTKSPNAKKEKNSDVAAPADAGEKKPDAPKYKKVHVDYPVQEEVPYSLNLDECIHVEKEMQKVDLDEKLTADSKNALEEYCYNMRDKLVDSLADFVTPDEVLKFQDILVQSEEWLYNEGESTTKEVYADKLNELRSVIETPISARQKELAEKKRKAAEAAAEQNNAPSSNTTTSEEKMDDTSTDQTNSTAI